uniref:SJCHGC06978 protein n=1 Tax=Schistosoma japonicum TaxID=6182 RepID=Q5DG04_SCHJA|nr:SJCHGC06978 protein [Schistosoma japonicum]
MQLLAKQITHCTVSPYYPDAAMFSSVLKKRILYSSFPKTSPLRCLHSFSSLTNGIKSPASSEDNNLSNTETQTENDLDKKKSSLVKRFKDAYTIYGKVVLVTHGITSCLRLASFYALACNGINLLDMPSKH